MNKAYIYPNEILDFIISIFKEDKTRFLYDINTINNKVVEKFKNVESLPIICTEAINKLIKDGLIRENTIKIGEYNSQNITHFSLTFDGHFFKGYVKTKSDVSHIEIRKDRNEVLLTVGTWLAGLGSILLVAVEICKNIFSTKP